jgi:hypothetical protein
MKKRKRRKANLAGILGKQLVLEKSTGGIANYRALAGIRATETKEKTSAAGKRFWQYRLSDVCY